MNLSLVRGTPFLLNPSVHIVLDGQKLCKEPAQHAVDYARTDVESTRDLCSVCERRLLARLSREHATEEEIVKLVRGDYSPQSPNKFWRSYGITRWSQSP